MAVSTANNCLEVDKKSPPTDRAGAIMRRIPTRRDHFCHEMRLWVGGKYARALQNLVNCEEGSNVVRSRVLRIHLRNRFQDVQYMYPFMILLSEFGSCQVVLPSELGKNTWSIDNKTWLRTLS